MPFFGNTPAGQTPRRISTCDGSVDADSHRGVYLGLENLKLMFKFSPTFAQNVVKFFTCRSMIRI